MRIPINRPIARQLSPRILIVVLVQRIRRAVSRWLPRLVDHRLGRADLVLSKTAHVHGGVLH